MKLKRNGIDVNLPDGVDPAKYVASSAVSSIPKDILKLFQDYGIDLKEECPGAFIKGFTLNEKELAEVNGNLKKYAEKGLIDVIKANPKNLQIRVFKNTFMERLEKLLQAGQPYLNSDNSFADFLLKNEMDKIPAQVPPTEVISARANEANKEVTVTDQMVQMSPEDKQVYNEIIEKLNYLVLANPMDTMLVNVVKNATIKVTDAIIRKEYKFLGIREMVESVMFDGLEITPEDNERITNLVLGAFPDEERKLA